MNDNTQLSVPRISDNESYTQFVERLTPEEREYYVQMAQDISLQNKSSLQHFASEVNTTISQQSVRLLESAKTNIDDDIIKYVTETVEALETINIEDLNPNKSFKNWLRSVPVLRKLVKTVQQIVGDYESVQESVDNISKKFETAKISAQADNSTLEEMKTNNQISIDNLRERIIALRLKREELNTEFERMKSENLDIWKIKEMENFIVAVDRKIANFEVIEQNLRNSQLRILAEQADNDAIADKCDDIVNMLIPNWKGEISQALIVRKATQKINAIQIARRAMNESILETSRKVKRNSENIATEMEETVISLETLKETNTMMIDMLKTVTKIHKEGEKDRRELENTLIDMRNRLTEEIKSIEYKQ